MFTFLPQKQRQSVTKEYKKRLLLIYVALVTFAGVAWIVSLIPSYILVTAKLDEAIIQKGTPVSGIDVNKISNTEKELLNAQGELAILTPFISQKPLSLVIAKLFYRIPLGVTLTSIALNRGEEKGNVVVSGIATTRDTLVSFSKALEGEAFFKKVELPVSNFTKGRDVPFSISIVASF